MGRIKQFIRCVAAKITEDDKRLIREYLDKGEVALLYKLPVYDMKHCINVARSIIENENEEYLIKKGINYKELVKSALLHDIGKSVRPLNPVDKSILVLLSKFTRGSIRKYEGKSKKIYIYFNHGKEGYKLIKGNDYSEEFLSVVRNHHDYSVSNEWLSILRKHDDMN